MDTINDNDQQMVSKRQGFRLERKTRRDMEGKNEEETGGGSGDGLRGKGEGRYQEWKLLLKGT